jgi:hypothetical protein
VRGDLRRDPSDEAIFETADGDTRKEQTTVSLNVIVIF